MAVPNGGRWLPLALLLVAAIGLQAADFVLPQGTISGTVRYPAAGAYGTVGTVATAADGTTVCAAGSNVTIYATGEIRLSPGFRAATGSEVRLSSCTVPTLTAVSALAGATEDTPAIIGFAALAAAANEASTDGGALAFRIESVAPGGQLAIRPVGGSSTPVVPPVVFDASQELVWTPPLDANGTQLVGTVTAYALQSGLVSTPAVAVSMAVAPVADAPAISSDAPATASLAAGVPLIVTVRVSDADTPVASLSLTGSSANTSLIPLSGIQVGAPVPVTATSWDYTVTVQPATSSAVGTTTVTLTVEETDTHIQRATSFTVQYQAKESLVDVADADVTTVYEYYPGGATKSITAYNRQGSSVATQKTQYFCESPYDLSLVTKVVYPDSQSATDAVRTDYDRLGKAVKITDQRQVERTLTYDKAGRLKRDEVTAGSSALQPMFDNAVQPMTTYIATRYDDLGRRRAVTTNLTNVVWGYDARGRVVDAAQTHSERTRSVAYAYDTGVTSGEVTYSRARKPDYLDGGGAKYLYGADAASVALNRVSQVVGKPTSSVDGQPVDVFAEYAYLGSADPVYRRTRRHSHTAGTYSDLAFDLRSGGTYTGIDRYGRLSARDWKLDGTIVEGQYLRYDGLGNPIYRLQTWPAPWEAEEAFAYDRLDRLRSMERGSSLAPPNGGFGPKVVPIVLNAEYWSLDSLGNWYGFQRRDTQDASRELAQVRRHNTANETELVTGTWGVPGYDAAGNVSSAAMPANPAVRAFYGFDAWNRLCIVRTGSATGPIIAAYAYDGLGRKVEERFKDPVTSGGETWEVWFSDAWQEVARSRMRTGSIAWTPGTALDTTSKPEELYWDAQDPDTLLGVNFATTASGVPLLDSRLGSDAGAGVVKIAGLRYAYDSSRNVTAVFGVSYNSGENPAPMRLIERNRYSPYGQRTVYRSANWQKWGEAATALVAQVTSVARHGFGLGITEQGFGLVHLRNRWYDPAFGRFVSRDPIGYVEGLNIYAYLRGGVIGKVDPSGLGEADEIKNLQEGLKAQAEANKEIKSEATLAALASGAAVSVAGSPRAESYQISTINPITFTAQSYNLEHGSPGDQLIKNVLLQAATPGINAVASKVGFGLMAAKTEINIDTGAAIAFSSARTQFRSEIEAFVSGKQMVMTKTAWDEFRALARYAGPTETKAAEKFLLRQKFIPDNPSERVAALTGAKALGEKDKIIFGTGDTRGITTLTGDQKFVNAAAQRGVQLDTYVHPPARFDGK